MISRCKILRQESGLETEFVVSRLSSQLPF